MWAEIDDSLKTLNFYSFKKNYKKYLLNPMVDLGQGKWGACSGLCRLFWGLS